MKTMTTEITIDARLVLDRFTKPSVLSEDITCLKNPPDSDEVVLTVETDSTSSGDDHDEITSSSGASGEVGIEGPELSDDGRTNIYVRAGQLQANAREAERCLANTGRHFQRSGAIVTVRTDPGTGESVVQELHPMALLHALDGVSAWMRFEKRSNSWVQIDPLEKVCNLMVRAGEFESLPVLNGLIRQPYLRPDGSLCQVAGHDPTTGLFGIFDSHEFDIQPEPTKENAKEALAILNDLLNEFSFASSSDRSASLSAMLTAAIRGSLPSAPMFHVRAPQISSGKSYLCELISCLASSQRGTPTGFPSSEDECGKLLFSQLVRSPPVIVFDNLTGDLKAYKSLCIALTSDRMDGRVLGRSKIMTVSTRTLLLSSGNNVGPVADMTRRCVTIQLDPACEVPAAREFKNPNLMDNLRRDRGRYVSAALTIVRAWIVAGQPLTECKPLASFTDWTSHCRQPLMWLGQPDPASAVFDGMADDPERQLLGRVLGGWREHFGTTALMVRDVISRTTAGKFGAEDFAEVLMDIAGERDRINARKLGRWLTRHAGRVVDGLRLVKAPKTRNAENWCVESVISVESVLMLPT